MGLQRIWVGSDDGVWVRADQIVQVKLTSIKSHPSPGDDNVDLKAWLQTHDGYKDDFGPDRCGLVTKIGYEDAERLALALMKELALAETREVGGLVSFPSLDGMRVVRFEPFVDETGVPWAAS